MRAVVSADPRAWALWAAFALLAVLLELNATPSIENVFDVYREAALRWRDGQDLYPAKFRFNYLPPSALFFVPWTWLPFAVGGALWRLVNVTVFALGVWRLCSHDEGSLRAPRFLLVSAITILLSASAAKYGQLTLTMAGLMMLAAADIQHGAHARAAFFAALAVALKPLAIVFVLVLVVEPRLFKRTLLALTLLLLLPFLFQHPDYVLRQYAAVPGMLVTRAEQPYPWEHIFGLMHSLGWIPTATEESLARGAGAILVLGLCRRVLRRPPVAGVALCLYAATSCYILLFGSATEANTYAMMAPIIGLLAANARRQGDRWLLHATMAMTLLTLLGHTLDRLLPNTPVVMVKPFVCAVLLVLVAWLVIRGDTAASASSPVGPPA